MTTMTDKSLVDLAYELGEEAGKGAAGWIVDGNTSTATLVWLAQGIADGDPEVLDAYNPPNLSGEYADEYDEDDLAADLGLEGDDHVLDDEANAWNDGASAGFWQEVESLALKGLDVPAGPYYIVYLATGMQAATSPEHAATLAGVKDLAAAAERSEGLAHGYVYGKFGAGELAPWLEAQKFAGTGVPFDYAEYALGVGPRGGITIEHM